MLRMKVPHVPEEPPAVIRPEDRDRLIASVNGRDFDDRRDAAILCLLFDTGMRRGELSGLRIEDVDLDDGRDVAYVGKGRPLRGCPFTSETAQAIRRYLKAHQGRASGGRVERDLQSRPRL